MFRVISIHPNVHLFQMYVAIKEKAISFKYFHVALVVKLYKVVLTSKSVDETLVCGLSKLLSSTFMWHC